MLVLRNFRHLPPLLRVVSIVGVLLILASLALSTVLVFHIQPFFPQSDADASRLQLVSLNLGLLGLIGAMLLTNFNMRMRQLGGTPFPLDTWRSQMLALMVLTALPLCGLLLALVLSPALKTYGIAFGISVLGMWVALGGFFWMLLWRAPAR